MKKLLYSSLLLLGCCTTAIGQTSATDPALVAKTQTFADEVFKDNTVYLSPQHMKIYAEWLSRVEVKSQAYTASEGYTLLSAVGLKDKYNPALQRDNAQNFNPAYFNPFKYFLEFEAKTDKIYRVDNTGYIIIVHAKQAGK